MNQESRRLAALAVALLLLGVAVKFSWDWISPLPVNSRPAEVPGPGMPGAAAADVSANAGAAVETTTASPARPEPGPVTGVAPENPPLPVAEPAAVAPASRFRVGLDSDSVHFNEVVVLLNSPDGYQSFLAHAGPYLTGRIPELLAVRLRGATAKELDVLLDTAFPQPELEIFNADLNWKMTLANALSPFGPPVAQPVDVRRIVGITHEVLQPPRPLEAPYQIDNTRWGAGMSLALLDTGVAENTTPLRGRLSLVDIGWGTMPDDRHGTALAVVAAGSRDLARGYMGISPAARILGVRVTAADGFSDVFSVAQGIVAAVNAGANIIAVSPTSPYPAAVLTRAVAYATANPAVAVAAARAEDLRPSWPAMTAGAFSVIAFDDLGAPVGPDGSTLRIERAPTVIVPSVPGPDLAALWVRLDTGPASATTMAAAMTAVFSLFPASTPAQVWTALHQFSEDASFALRPEGEGFRQVFFRWLSASDGAGDENAAATVPAPAPAGTGTADATQLAGFLPGTPALDPSTGRPRVTVIRTGPPTGATRGSTPTAGRAGARGAPAAGGGE
jgi:hypothetical protein